MPKDSTFSIRVLAICPVSANKWGDDQGDANGHRYPHYYYVQGSTWDCLTGKRFLGVPVEFERCMREMSSSTMLRRYRERL
jgi:hypothetical protein